MRHFVEFRTMTLNWEFMLPAVLLLWLPLPGAPVEGLRRKDAPPNVTGLLRAWQNWVDLLRSFAGVYLLTMLAFGSAPASRGDTGALMGIRAVILCLGMLMQMIRFNDGFALYAPIFYATGLALMTPGYVLGAFAAFFGWALACGLKDFRLLLPVMALALGVSSYFWEGVNRPLLIICGLIALPFLLAMLLQRPLLFTQRPKPVLRDDVSRIA